MKHPSKALILAAGLGTRMRPLTDQVPKPMLPFWGRPLLSHTLELLERWGVTDVLLNLHHQPSPILDYVRHRAPSRIRISLSFEPVIMGTGGALRKADWFFDSPEFWVVNGDIAASVDPRPFLDTYRKSSPLAVLWLYGNGGPRTVRMENGMISDFRCSDAGADGTYTFTGVQLVSRKLLDFIPDSSASSIVDAYISAMRAGKRVAGICPDKSFWSDLGTPASYLEAHAKAFEGKAGTLMSAPDVAPLSRRGVKIEGWASIGQNVTFAGKAHIRNSVLWNDVHVASGAIIENAIVGAGTRIAGHVSGQALRADDIEDPVAAMVLARMSWPASSTTVLPLPPRGSARTFSRIRHGTRSAILIQYNIIERPENALYSAHTRLLRKAGLPVPTLMLDLPDQRVLLVEDAGDVSLTEQLAGKSRRQVIETYCEVIRVMMAFHIHGTRAAKRSKPRLMDPFSPELYAWERELFHEHFLVKRLGMATADIGLLLNDLQQVEQTLLKEQSVLIHRDFQSSNVLFKAGNPMLIDFQGMRFGPAVYDLASLLCDPYIGLDTDIQTTLLSFYMGNSGIRPNTGFEARFWAAAVQRLIQALGAYARLGANRHTEHFTKHIAPALKMLDRALSFVNKMDRIKAWTRQQLKNGGKPVKLIPILLLMVMTVAGCSDKPKEADKPAVPIKDQPRPTSTAQQVIEDMTGKTSVKAGLRAQATIQRVSDQENKDLEEVMK